MTHFRDDNTEGYTDEQLSELNRRVDDALAAYCGAGRVAGSVDDLGADLVQMACERVQAKYDTEVSK